MNVARVLAPVMAKCIRNAQEDHSAEMGVSIVSIHYPRISTARIPSKVTTPCPLPTKHEHDPR